MDRYIYANTDLGAFVKMPMELIKSQKYAKVSADAKLLYALLLDRTAYSIKNGWLDESKRAYIVFTLEEVCEYMNCRVTKAKKLLKELDEGCDLIERIRQGRNSHIYVKVVEMDSQNKIKGKSNNMVANATISHNIVADKATKVVADTTNNMVANETTIQTNIKQTTNNIYHHLNNTPDEDEITLQVKEQIEYDKLIESNDTKQVDTIVHYLVDGLSTSNPQTTIHSRAMDTNKVRQVLSSLTRNHIQTLIKRLKNIKTEIICMRSYMLTALYDISFSVSQAELSKVRPSYYRDYDFGELERMLIEN